MLPEYSVQYSHVKALLLLVEIHVAYQFSQAGAAHQLLRRMLTTYSVP